MLIDVVFLAILVVLLVIFVVFSLIRLLLSAIATTLAWMFVALLTMLVVLFSTLPLILVISFLISLITVEDLPTWPFNSSIAFALTLIFVVLLAIFAAFTLTLSSTAVIRVELSTMLSCK